MHEYDQLNRLVASTLPDGSVERFEYDALGRVLGHTAPGGLRTNTEYDAAGRPVAVSYANMSGRKNPGATSYVYDAVGNLIEASNGVSTVSHTYDALGNAVSETVDYKDVVLEPLTRGYDGKGLLEEVRPPGSGNDISYVRDASGRISQISQNAAVVSAQYYIGARPVLRENFLNTTSVCNTVSGPDPTGRKVGLSVAANEDFTTVHDWRTYAWDGAYNLDEYEVTSGPLTASAVDYDYDELNRLDPASISAGWTLDDAGNRDYTMSGDDALMHRYTDVGVGGVRYYDGLGALKSVALGTWYDYDALGRLVKYTEIAAASMTADGTPTLPSASWDVIDGTWEWDNNGTGGDPSDDFLKETTTDSAALLRIGLDPMYSVALEYRNNRAADNSDNDGTTGEYGTDDNWSKYYTEVLLAVDVTNDPDFAYLALRIEPDRIGLIEYNGTTVRELDTASVIGVQSVWYGVRASFGADGAVSVVRTSATAGDAIVTLSGISTVLDGLGGTTETIGFTMGAEGRYQFRVVELADTADSITAHMEWDYDAYGRKLAQTTYDGSGAITAQTRYVYDGARLVQEVDALDDNDVIADYVHGPGYVDDVIRSRRDLDDDGFETTENFYHLQDQQHSTVGLIDGTGAAVEYYTYDAFGVPTIYEEDGTTPRSVSIAGNDILYTGRTWLAELNLYDYRQRMYDPSIGRFLSTDPVFDPVNMGNPYTYVGNNPGAFTDPFGAWAWDNDWLQTGLELFGAGVFTGRGGAAAHSFWVESGGEQLQGMGQGAGTILSGDLLVAREGMIAGTAAMYEQRIMLHYGTNGGSIEDAIGTASGAFMVGSDLAGFTELDEARTGLDYGSGDTLSGQDRVQRAFSGTSKLAGTVALGGSATRGIAQITKKAEVPPITQPYKRPTNATTKAQRLSVQGKPCVDCGKVSSNQVADHKIPLVVEYYETGKINSTKMHSLDAIQPQCPSCSNYQGGKLSAYSKSRKKDLGL